MVWNLCTFLVAWCSLADLAMTVSWVKYNGEVNPVADWLIQKDPTCGLLVFCKGTSTILAIALLYALRRRTRPAIHWSIILGLLASQIGIVVYTLAYCIPYPLNYYF